MSCCIADRMQWMNERIESVCLKRGKEAVGGGVGDNQALCHIWWSRHRRYQFSIFKEKSKASGPGSDGRILGICFSRMALAVACRDVCFSRANSHEIIWLDAVPLIVVSIHTCWLDVHLHINNRWMPGATPLAPFIVERYWLQGVLNKKIVYYHERVYHHSPPLQTVP